MTYHWKEEDVAEERQCCDLGTRDSSPLEFIIAEVSAYVRKFLVEKVPRAGIEERQHKKYLHIIIAFSPIGDAFRNHIRQYPSLINCCSIDWFDVSNKCIAVRKVATPLRELTCHMGSHSVTCHLAELTFPPLPQPKLVLD